MTDSAAAAALPQTALPPTAHHPSAWHNGESFGFRDLLDIVNPLQHIPIVASIYRWATGDRPGEAAQIAGDALYGGPIGVGVGLVSAAFEDSQGRDLPERAMVAMFGPGEGTTAVASTAAPAAAPTASAATPAATPAATQSAASTGAIASAANAVPATPDHPPMALYGGIALPTAAPSGAAAQNPAARALLARAAPLQAAAQAPRSGATITAPVPLVVPAGALPAGTVPAGLHPAAQAGQPLDISQKMLDGLDKYMKLEQERKKAAPGPDAAPPTPGVDLSL